MFSGMSIVSKSSELKATLQNWWLIFVNALYDFAIFKMALSLPGQLRDKGVSAAIVSNCKSSCYYPRKI